MAGVLGIIPARGGSKGIPNKNITLLGNKPLIQWTIQAAQQSAIFDDLVVSTDSQAIADVAAKLGMAMHGLRPAELSGDTAKTLDVIRYEIDAYEQRTGKTVTDIVLLQPTSPLRIAGDIDLSFAAYKASGLPSLISVCDIVEHPSIMYYEQEGQLAPYTASHQGVRRQDMPTLVRRNGAIYISARSQIALGEIISQPCAYHKMPKERSINIDEPADIAYAQWLVTKGTG